MVDFCVYLFYRAALGLITALPLRARFFASGRRSVFFAWLFLPNYRRLARQNVEIAFGEEKSATEKDRIVRRHFQQLGANLLSGMKLNAMPVEQVARACRARRGRRSAPAAAARADRSCSCSAISATGS